MDFTGPEFFLFFIVVGLAYTAIQAHLPVLVLYLMDLGIVIALLLEIMDKGPNVMNVLVMLVAANFAISYWWRYIRHGHGYRSLHQLGDRF